ncbi:MAG: hypothetical protein FJ286_12215 [Planctomycetes bacterium]|nr:hypothetical protein [Planctomycetota bacterium]
MAERAPEDVQRIVKRVLCNGVSNCIRFEPEPRECVKALLTDGQKPSTAVRELLRKHGGNVFVAESDEDCRFYVRDLYFMTPETMESGVRKVMYVKFALDIDPDDESLSVLVVIRFHASIGCESITRFP